MFKNQKSSLIWIVEISPFLFVIVSLWLKLIHFSIFLKSSWWAPEETTSVWVYNHPEMFTSSLSGLLLLIWFVPLLKRVWRYLLLIVINFLITSILLANQIHFYWYGDIISFSSLLKANMLPLITPSILKLLSPLDLLYFLDIIISIIIFPYYFRICKRITKLEFSSLKHISFATFILGLVFIIPSVNLFFKDKSREAIISYKNLQGDVAASLGLINYLLIDSLIRYFRTD